MNEFCWIFKLQKAAEMLDKEEHEKGSNNPQLKAKLYEMREQKRDALRKSALQATETNSLFHQRNKMVCR